MLLCFSDKHVMFCGRGLYLQLCLQQQFMCLQKWLQAERGWLRMSCLWVGHVAFFRRSCLSSLLAYISVKWRLSGISEICRFIGFHKDWKWRVGKQRKSRSRLNEPIKRKLKRLHHCNACVLRNFASFVNFIFEVLLSNVFLYWNNKQLRVKQNILWIKWITSSDVNRFIVKGVKYYPIIIRLASQTLGPDSRVYNLSHEISLCCKICKRVRCDWNLIESKRLNSTTISNKLN